MTTLLTLDRWRGLLETPQTIFFRKLTLQGRDHDPPLVEGSGEVRLPTLGRIEFTLRGQPADIGAFLRAIKDHEDHPFDGLTRMRLTGTDADGVEWSLGWTWPKYDMGDTDWTFVGDLEALHPHDPAAPRSEIDGTELMFVIPDGSPMDHYLRRFVRTPQAEGRPLASHSFIALGSDIGFAYDVAHRVLTVTATQSPALPPTYMENWLGQPLRILFGELVGARLIARNFHRGQGFAYARTVSTRPSRAGWAALWNEEAGGAEEFWALYRGLLILIAQARSQDGQPQFEANKVTRLYEEVIQAAAGSRWVWALTFASGIEGLVNLLEPRGPRSATEVAAAETLADQIEGLEGDGRLKQVAVNAVRRAATMTSVDSLRRLRDADVVTKEQTAAWDALRNRVAHGSLVSPYNNEKEDGQLLALSNMFHALTRELIRREVAAPARERRD
jgi:hypothetical protein